MVLHGVRVTAAVCMETGLKLQKRLQERQADKTMEESINSIHNTLD